jgi:LysR family cys regulon transcriptional activator
MNIVNALTLKQLRYLREVKGQGLNISAAATALHASQSGVSRQIQEIEQVLGVPLLTRRRNRVLAFTEVGLAVLQAAERMLSEVENIRAIVEEHRKEGSGHLVVATSHLHARYTLRGPAKAFIKCFPRVQLGLLQADANEIHHLVESNQADIGISSDALHVHPAVALMSGGKISRSIIMPKGHRLASRRKISLKDLAAFPIVGYSPRSTSGAIMEQAFAAHKIEPHFVVRAADSDVIIAYVADGLGVSVVPTLSLAEANPRIHAVDAGSLFPPSTMTISVRRNAYLRQYAMDFIAMVAPALSREAIRKAIAHEVGAQPVRSKRPGTTA